MHDAWFLFHRLQSIMFAIKKRIDRFSSRKKALQEKTKT